MATVPLKIVTATEFRDKQKEFFDFSHTGRVIIRKGKDLYELVANPIIETIPNPSPSNDPYFNDPDNIADILEGIEQAKQGKATSVANAQELSMFLDKL